MPDDLQEEIRIVAERIPGCSYVSLVGCDGITVAQYIVDADFDVNLYDAEISSIMLASKEVRKSLDLGLGKELIWLTDKHFYIIHPVGEDYFVYACLKPDGSSPGLARIELNKLKESIRKIIYSETS
jgi:predicted regulator of Ras-like GTPase activity (Roadblock/LC7/MglB family)